MNPHAASTGLSVEKLTVPLGLSMLLAPESLRRFFVDPLSFGIMGLAVITVSSSSLAVTRELWASRYFSRSADSWSRAACSAAACCSMFASSDGMAGNGMRVSALSGDDLRETWEERCRRRCAPVGVDRVLQAYSLAWEFAGVRFLKLVVRVLGMV